MGDRPDSFKNYVLDQLGVLGVTAGLVFAASLQSVIDVPQRYGWTWDITTEDQVVNTPCGGDTRGVEQLPGVEAVAELCYGPGLQVDGRTVPSMDSAEPQSVPVRILFLGSMSMH